MANYSLFDDASAAEFMPDASVELGMAFSSSELGIITAIRYFKTGEGGAATGRLWSETGALLATASFVDQSAFGWQTAQLSQPVVVGPDALHVASYHAPFGYSYTTGFFDTAVTSGPLTAAESQPDRGNGLFVYGEEGWFPTDTYLATNYWVDVVYSSIEAPSIVDHQVGPDGHLRLIGAEGLPDELGAPLGTLVWRAADGVTLATGAEFDISAAPAATWFRLTADYVDGAGTIHTLQDDVRVILNHAGGGSLRGGAGQDAMFGQEASDALHGRAGDDTLMGFGGADALFGNGGDDALHGGEGDDGLRGGPGRDAVHGGAGSDALHGGGGDDTLLGEAGGDFLRGGIGHDVLEGGTDDDSLGGGADDDFLNGGDGVDALAGGGGDDTLLGEAGQDLLRGGNGDDVLEGGAGADRLRGGEGADVFRFEAADEGGDRIVDFSRGIDKIELRSAAFFGVDGSGALDPEFFPQGAAAMGDHAQFTYQNGRLLWHADGESGGSVLLATFQRALELEASDFLLI